MVARSASEIRETSKDNMRLTEVVKTFQVSVASLNEGKMRTKEKEGIREEEQRHAVVGGARGGKAMFAGGERTGAA